MYAHGLFVTLIKFETQDMDRNSATKWNNKFYHVNMFTNFSQKIPLIYTLCTWKYDKDSCKVRWLEI